MPQTRRSTRSKNQATLSFKSTGAKVSKPLQPVGKKSLSPTRSIQKLKIDSGASTPVKELSKSPISHVSTPTVEKKPRVPSEDEKFAERIPRKQINDYYKKKIVAVQNIAPVHQEKLTINEKIMRNFDMSSHYGPCTGISRLNRWKRAQKLGLKPPIEVLAVIVDAEKREGGTEKHRDERLAWVDEFLRGGGE